MRNILLALALVWAAPVLAQTAREPAVEQVITEQIRAFEADDFAAAFSHASPGIRGLFGTPEVFGRMVREGYPMVWRPSAFRFLGVTPEAGALHQKVLVTDAQGVTHLLDYTMIQTPDGWRIDAVRILRAPDLNA
jgi:hypothetical protein